MVKIPEHIQNYILSRTWEMDRIYGLTEFARFLFEINSGLIPNYSEMRSRNAPIILNNGYVFQGNAWNVRSSDIPEGSIIKMSLSGTMIYEDGECSYGVKSLANTLYDAYNNSRIAGILIEANSGGGESTAGNALMSAVADKNKPVVFHFHTLGSAALKAALPANEIIAASPSAKAGSIGTFVSVSKEILAWYAENILDIYADQSPDKNAEFNALLAGDLGPIKKMVNRDAELFQREVVKYRSLKGSDDYQAQTLAGGMFDANIARSRGLIDGIGSLNYAIKRLNSHIKNQAA